MKLWREIKRTVFSLRGSTLSLAASPLWLAAIIGFFQGRPFKTAITLTAAVSITAAARLTRQYFTQAAYGKPVTDGRQTAMLLTGAGAGILGVYLLRQPMFIALTALLAGAAYYYHYIFGVLPPEQEPDENAPETVQESEPAQPTLDLSVLNEALQADVLTALEAIRTIHQSQPVQDLTAAKTLAKEQHFPPENTPVMRYDEKRRQLAEQALALTERAAESEAHVRKLRALLVGILPSIADTAQLLAKSGATEELYTNFSAVLDGALDAISEQLQEFNQAQHHALDIKINVLSQQLNATREKIT